MTTQAELWELQKKAYQSTEIANELRARAAREDERAAEYRKQLGQDAGTEVEELAEALNDSAAPYYYPFDWSEATGIAASLLASGYRKSCTINPKRTIRTHQERAALKPGTICMDLAGNAWKRGTGSWVGTGEGGALYDEENLTMIILHEPDDTK